ncbi:winged helix-turn helix [Propionibacterium acidifaciens F0233]|uniref:Winged helix-turn helix n=1 Tax=Propionibacterium acidifaciens F0233 TaxID=553198 RepID=U2R132_9ACTN|nr:winged helix-turn helix [Propionibacterium acidifaciens F0233]
MDFLCRFGYDRGVQVGVTPEETAVLIRWRKRSDNHALVRMKAEAILYASEGVSTSIIAKMVERAERTVQEWPADWQATRMCPVLTGHAGNQDAAEPARAQKEELKAILAQPPSPAGVRAGFWDVPAIREVVKILFDARYQADSSYQLLLRLCGPSLEPPDPFDEHRDEKAVTRRMAWATTQVKALLDAGWEVYAVGEVRLEHEAWTRRMQPPKGQRTRPVRGPEEDVPVLPRRPLPDQQKVKLYPIEGNRNTWQTILALDLLQRETEAGKIAVVPDNARFHHAKMLAGLHGPGQLLERITPIHPPPYAPDHNPVEHVRNAARNNIATIQRETPEETLGASASYVTDRTVDYDFEHLPAPRNQKRFCFMTAIGTISTDAAKNINTYRTPRRGVGDREALDGLDPADFQVGDKSAYAGDEAAARTFADPRIGNYENGYTRFDMHPDFKNEFAQYKSPYTEGGPSSVQYAIPAGKIDRFNELTINREWVSYDKISGS